MTRDDILERIKLGVDGAIKLFQRNGVEVRLLRELANSAMDCPGVAKFLAAMPATPSSILGMLLQRGDGEVLPVLALNALCLPKIAASPLPSWRVVAAGSRKITPAVAAQLVDDPSIDVRLALAHNPAIAPNIQLKLSKDPVSFVRLALLENRKLDEEFQIDLGDDCDTLVHACTLLNPRLSPACMKIWAQFDEELGQLALAGRRDLPPPIVEMLEGSRFDSVRLRLLESQQLDERALLNFATSGDDAVRMALAARQDLPSAVIEALWRHGDCGDELKRRLAVLPALSDAIALPMLENAAASDHGFLYALALNSSPDLTQTRLQLASIGSSYLCKLMAANPQCAIEPVLSALIIHAPEEALCHLAYRMVDCSGISDAARERLRRATLPGVSSLASSS